jgi:site-specific recombinase XerD
MLELLDEPIARVRLPLLRVQWRVDTAARPTVALPNCSPPLVRPAPPASSAPAVAADILAGGVASGPGTIRREAVPKGRELATAAPPAKINGNGSPVIQKGHNKGVKPSSFGKSYAPEPLTPADVFALLAATPKTGAPGIRNRALIVLLWRSGLRIQEALDLYPKDINFDENEIHVLHGKGDRHGICGTDDRCLAYLTEWLDYRQERLGIDRYTLVFCTVQENGFGGRGLPLGQAYVRRMLKKLARRAGVDRRVTPHQFRHALASEWRREGHDLEEIQGQLRHANPSTTDRYLRQVAPVRVIRAAKAREWPEALT